MFIPQVNRVSKIGEWKTIDQRETAQRRNRKWQRGGAVAISGGAAFSAAAMSDRDEVRNGIRNGLRGRQFVRDVESSSGLKLSPGQKAKLVGTWARSNPRAAVALGGLGVAGLGAGTWVTGRGLEAYHQRKINERRRANRQVRKLDGSRPELGATAFGKRERLVEPERDRQRNLGATIGGLGVAGAGLTGYNGRQLYTTTRDTRRGQLERVANRGHQSTAAKEAKAAASLDKPPFTLVGRPRHVGGAAAGLGLLAGATALHRHARSDRNRKWT